MIIYEDDIYKIMKVTKRKNIAVNTSSLLVIINKLNGDKIDLNELPPNIQLKIKGLL